jgi:hypothetical protein
LTSVSTLIDELVTIALVKRGARTRFDVRSAAGNPLMAV